MATVLDISKLSVTFDTPDGDVEAVKNLSLSVEKGECLGIVGGERLGHSPKLHVRVRAEQRKRCRHRVGEVSRSRSAGHDSNMRALPVTGSLRIGERKREAAVLLSGFDGNHSAVLPQREFLIDLGLAHQR